MRAPALVLLVAVTGAGCATKADVQTLETSLAQDMADIRDDQRLLLAQLEEAVDSLDAANARRASMEQGEVERRVLRLEDALAEVIEIVTQNNQLLNDIYAARVSQGGPGRPGVGPADAGPSFPSGRQQGAADQLYELTLDQFRQGNLETARGGFEEFLAAYPEHTLAPDAQYYVALTYEQAGERAAALVEYQRVTERWPDSSRAPAALLRRGIIEAARGNTAIARRLFTQIESGYPNSIEAPLAREELRKLGG